MREANPGTKKTEVSTWNKVVRNGVPLASSILTLYSSLSPAALFSSALLTTLEYALYASVYADVAAYVMPTAKFQDEGGGDALMFELISSAFWNMAMA